MPIAMLPTFMAFFCRWRIKSVRPYFASAISFSFDFGLFGYLLLDRLMPGPEVFVVYFVVSVPIWLLGFAGVLLAQRSLEGNPATQFRRAFLATKYPLWARSDFLDCVDVIQIFRQPA
ncbi:MULTISPECIES: hypothetical protein [Eikenella]|uniref:Uncharacterized protein n=1 Tax=Eikenella exigua TaxID=2528037 RepID=A0AAX1F834_9NEIS|nr:MULTISPECIES: hypothetical protein [Eikenella]QED92263.1 hypothetical protein EZJ17_06330 [Eikenella exigua]